MTMRISMLSLFLASLFLSVAIFVPGIAAAQDFGDAFDGIGDIGTGDETPGGSGPTVGEQYDDIQRQGLIFAGICASPATPCECRDTGRCTLEDILQVVVNLSVFILGISGSLVLIMFIYGGFMWLTAGGAQERVKKGRDIMVGAVIGLIIIFGAYTVITVLISVLKTGTVPESGENLEDVIGGDAGSVINTTNQ